MISADCPQCNRRVTLRDNIRHRECPYCGATMDCVFFTAVVG